MADGEVKIHVSADADTSAMDDAQRKIDGMQGRSQNATELNPRPRGPQEVDTSVKPGGWDALEKRRQDLLKLRKEQKDLENRGDSQGAKDLGSRADKLEKNIDKEGARLLRVEADEAKRSEADRTREAKERITQERIAAKERADAERAATREMKEQEAMRAAGINAVRSVASLVGGAILADVLPTVVNLVGARETLENRGAATSARDERRLRILKSVRGTSQDIVGDIWATEDRIAERERERPQLETDRKYSTTGGALAGAAAGAGVGAAVGSFVPVLGTAVGAGVGAAIGGTFGGIRSYMEGSNRIRQADQDQTKDQEYLANANAEVKNKFLNEEGGLQLEQLRGRAKRTMDGHREAFVAQMAEQWMQTYRDVYTRTKDSGVAKEMADLTVQNTLRERQQQAASGLVDAYTGGAGIAAAAKWSGAAMPSMDQLVGKTDQLLNTVQQGNQENQIVKQHK